MEIITSTFEDVADTISWTADGKINYVADGTYMTYPGTSYSSDIIFPRKHYYYDGMGNRVAVVTEETSSVNATEIFEQYCYETGIPYVGCEDCRKQLDFTIDTYFYEAGGKLLYKNKLINDNGIDIYCVPSENDVEWYVYGSASDGRVATVYPRFKIQDNELYDNNFEDSPPNPAVAYNTEMVSNTFTAVAGSANITGIETHRHLGEKRYEIKDHLGNVRAVVSDIKNAENYSLSASSWKFLADVRSMSNYYPYGLKIDKGSWSSSNYQFAYNGKQEEPFNKNFLNFGARTHNTELGIFIKTDPKENTFAYQSPYAYAGNNPILYIDYLGESRRRGTVNNNNVRNLIRRMSGQQVNNNRKMSGNITLSNVRSNGKRGSRIDGINNYKNGSRPPNERLVEPMIIEPYVLENLVNSKNILQIRKLVLIFL